MKSKVRIVIIGFLLLFFGLQSCTRNEMEKELDLALLDSFASFFYENEQDYMANLLYSVILRKCPGNAMYTYRVGISSGYKGDTSGLYLIGKSIELKYFPIENPWYSMAYIYYEVEDFMRCKYCCTQAIKHNDTVVTFYVLRARCSWRFGLNEEACKDISEVEKLMMKKYVPPYPILCRN